MGDIQRQVVADRLSMARPQVRIDMGGWWPMLGQGQCDGRLEDMPRGSRCGRWTLGGAGGGESGWLTCAGKCLQRRCASGEEAAIEEARKAKAELALVLSAPSPKSST